jgi:NADH:ubiquinone oxidoreductase subunit 4 (subunit M)
VSGGLFLCVGVVYVRMHTRVIAAYGGLVNRMPLYAVVFMVFTMANVGLPGTSGFVGEFLTLLGTFKVNVEVATFATLGVILSACYALWLYRKMVFGKLDKPKLLGIKDMNYREIGIFAPLVILTLLGAFKVNTWVALFATTGVILSAAYALWLYRRVIFGALDKESLKGLLDLSMREKALLFPLAVLVIFFGVYPAPVFDVISSSVDQLISNYQAAIEAAGQSAAAPAAPQG